MVSVFAGTQGYLPLTFRYKFEILFANEQAFPIFECHVEAWKDAGNVGENTQNQQKTPIGKAIHVEFLGHLLSSRKYYNSNF